MSDEQKRQIDALKAEVAELRAQLWSGGPRLGPRRETPEEQQEKALKLADMIGKAVSGDLEARKPPALCTTNGKPVAEVRASQTNETGQHDGYVVLCPDERAKGFVRPYRDRYRHTTCGTVTTMGRALSETYARDPKFYGATFCCGCNRHLPVGEFVWTADNQVVGS